MLNNDELKREIDDLKERVELMSKLLELKRKVSEIEEEIRKYNGPAFVPTIFPWTLKDQPFNPQRPWDITYFRVGDSTGEIK